jgi:hypothetical protein
LEAIFGRVAGLSAVDSAYNLFMHSSPSSTSKKPAAKTYFGITALITGIISGVFLAANIGAAYLKITPGTFSQLNNLTALFFCILTPLTFILGVIGHTRKNDSKVYSRIAIALVTIPFAIMFAQFVYSFVK